MPTDLKKHIKFSLALEELINQGWTLERRANLLRVNKGEEYHFFDIRNADHGSEPLELDRAPLMMLLDK